MVGVGLDRIRERSGGNRVGGGGRTLRIAGVAGALIALALAVSPAVAHTSGAGCPNASSGWFIVDKQGWWDTTVEGLLIEGVHPYVNDDPSQGWNPAFDQFATDNGFDGADGLFDFVWNVQWQQMDKNNDRLVCMKWGPDSVGKPAYLFGGVDNNASPSASH